MKVLLKALMVGCLLLILSEVGMATSSAKGIVYIPVSMSDESTVIKLPKDRIIFIPVVYTSWFSTGSWPYYAMESPYYGLSGLKEKDGYEKQDLNCLSGTGIEIGVTMEIIEEGKSRDVVTLDVSKCKGGARGLLELAFESVRLTANDVRQKRVRPRIVIRGKKEDVKKWGKLTSEMNAHDFTRPYKR